MNRMVSPDFVNRKGVAHWTENSVLVSSKVLMQYTGIKDKNGKEIYDGDIVNDSENVFVVRFGKFETLDAICVGWYLDHITTPDFSGPFTSDDSSVIEVIGNIYENPEPLNQ